MEIVTVEPRDIHVVIDLSITEVKHLVNFLDNCSIEFDSKEHPELSESISFVTEKFFKMCDDIINDVKEGGVGNES